MNVFYFFFLSLRRQNDIIIHLPVILYIMIIKTNTILRTSVSVSFSLILICLVLSCRSRGQREESPVSAHSYTKAPPVRFKFFLERSGSMTPFDATTTSGDFKSAITSFLNSIPDGNAGAENLLFIVNDAVYPFNKSYKEFIQSKNVFADTKDVGDPRYTDFTCIFDSILAKTEKNEVAVLVSDLIYSTPNMAQVNCTKILNEAKSLTRSVFKGKTSKDVLVVKMLGDYDGSYYTYNSPNKGQQYNGIRPYYFVVVATPDVMQRLFNDKKYKESMAFSDRQGYEDFYCFSNEKKVNYSVLLSNKRNEGRFGAVRGQSNTIHEVEKIEADRNGSLTMTIAVDLSGIIVPEIALLDVKNYEVTSISGFKVKEIEEIKDSERDEKLRAIPSATHFIMLSTQNKIAYETLNLRFKNELPSWVSKSNTDDDTNLNSSDFSTTTFAFKYMMDGIYEAYYGTVEDPSYFQIELIINK